MVKELSIVENICPVEKWKIKCPNPMNPEFVVIHNTGNNASARNEIEYMISNNNETSFHYAVDDIEAVQGLPLYRNGWHASDGNGIGNRKGIGIEICYQTGTLEQFRKSEDNAAFLVAKILKERNWDISRVKKHQDFCEKRCPKRTLEMGWQRFLNMVQSYMFTPIKYGRDYSPIFNADYYDEKYYDLNVFHHDKGALFEHFLTYGVYEGRVACEDFIINDYIILNPDLESAFMGDRGAYAQHYIDYGRAEGRRSVISNYSQSQSNSTDYL